MDVNQERLVNSFIKLVQIDSESGDEKKITEYLKKELASLGFKVIQDKIGNLIASNGPEPLMALCAHVDTVKPGKGIKPIVTKDGEIKTNGDTILGADDKSGVASILEILHTLKENGKSIDLEIVFTVQEELGLIGSTALDFSLLKSKRAINLDAGPEDILIGEPSIMHFDIEIIGKAAHSGIHPEQGINVVEIAVEAIKNLKWGRIDDETTSNLGQINAGIAINIVPERATLLAEIRSRNLKTFDRYCKELVGEFNKAAKKFGGKVAIKAIQRTRAYIVSENDPLVKSVAWAIQKNGITPEIKPTGGATDANNFNSHGIVAITTGSCGESCHSKRESIKVTGLTLGAQIVMDAILSLKK